MNSAPVAADRFRAWCPCPRCGLVACHRWRQPLPKPVRGPARVFPDGTTIERFDGMSGPDESMFEVIRICDGCGREWGVEP